jgi:hypothetical protein
MTQKERNKIIKQIDKLLIDIKLYQDAMEYKERIKDNEYNELIKKIDWLIHKLTFYKKYM